MRENAINERRNFFLETLDKGLEEGQKEGIEQEKIQTVIRLNNLGLDTEQISKGSGLSVEEVNSILSKLE
ncbi:MAG: hypothetical protein RR782_06810, partial [Clostridium sp.]